jgi:hypothetical protein
VTGEMREPLVQQQKARSRVARRHLEQRRREIRGKLQHQADMGPARPAEPAGHARHGRTASEQDHIPGL